MNPDPLYYEEGGVLWITRPSPHRSRWYLIFAAGICVGVLLATWRTGRG